MASEKKTVLVTGSSRGIGFEIARKFASAGNNVIINGREDSGQLKKAVMLLSEYNVTGFLADFSDYDKACEVFAEAKKIYGSVDILINNAGMAHFGLFSEMTTDEMELIMRHNFTNTLNATHLAIPDMVSAKKGVIINISSVWGNTGASCEAVYAAAKGAVNAFTKSLAQELGPSGVRVCAVACGAVETRMNARLSCDERAEFAEKIPLMRFGTAKEVADLVFFIASDKASYLTGCIIEQSGGL